MNGPPEKEAPPAVEAKGIGLAFGDYQALVDIDLSVPQGAFVSIIGPNGAGKTTLLHVLLGIQTPSQGTVSLFGGPPGALEGKHIGYVPQRKTLDRSFPATALELVVTGLRGRGHAPGLGGTRRGEPP